MRKVHDWIRLEAAITDGDKEKAEEILRNSEEIVGPKRIAGYSAIKRAFPEEPPEFVSAGERKRLEDERGNNSPIADSLARRRESRQQRADAIRSHTKKQAGPYVPIPVGEEHLYGKPEPTSFNTPVNDAAGTRKGAGRAKVSSWVPGSGGGA